MTQHIHTRAKAAALGLAKFYTGKLCRRGHNDFRYTASGACASCVAGYRKRYTTAKNNAAMERGTGAVVYTALLHPEDVPAVRELVDALAMARLLT